MKLFPLVALLATATWVLADVPEGAPEATGLNVNSRYTVESVDVAPRREYRLSAAVLHQMRSFVGERLDVDALGRLSRQMTQELKARSVTFRVARGNEQAHVRVTFEVQRQETNFDVSLSKLMYDSRLGWSGIGQASASFGDNLLTMAALSNADDQVERYSGIRARYDRLNVISERLRLSLEFDAYHEQFDHAASTGLLSPLSSSLGAGAFTSRLNVEPSATFLITRPLTVTVGMSFERTQPVGASVPATPDAANLIFNTIRYHRQWEGPAEDTQELDAAYRFRAALRLLGSDRAYTRQSMHARYTYRHERQLVEVAVTAGIIYGQAPLFERFVLGNTSTLRGWSKDEIDPLGGNRAAHASVTYGYHIMRVFYDTGSVWDAGRSPEPRNSLGAGITTGLGLFGKDALLLAVAFPIRQGRVQPVFTAGMSF